MQRVVSEVKLWAGSTQKRSFVFQKTKHCEYIHLNSAELDDYIEFLKETGLWICVPITHIHHSHLSLYIHHSHPSLTSINVLKGAMITGNTYLNVHMGVWEQFEMDITDCAHPLFIYIYIYSYIYTFIYIVMYIYI